MDNKFPKERPEVISFIKNQLLSRTEYYNLYSQLDDLSGGASIEEINIINIRYETNVNGRTDFFGVLLIKAGKEIGIKKLSFTGTFEGYFDESGVYLESASLDVST